jgi:cytosine deaminase
MLERAMFIGYRQGFLTDDDLTLAFNLGNREAARVLGLTDHGIAVGARADLVAVPAASIPEAVVAHPSRMMVMKAGRVVAGGEALSLPVAS